MSVAAIAADVAQSGDVLLDRAPQRAFDQHLLVDQTDDLCQFFFAELFRATLRIDARFFQKLQRVRRPDAIDVAKADLNFLIGGDIHASNTGHS